MMEIPALSRLRKARRVLLAGAGGGFDVYSALPLYFALKEQGVEVHLASLSFAALRVLRLDWVSDEVAMVTADSTASDYFPERSLALFLRSRGLEVPIWSMENNGLRPTRDGYRFLVQHLDLDGIILVDGGSDSLLRGDETGLGTPVEDYVSIGAVAGIELPLRMLVSVGFGVDRYHGVCHAQVLRTVAELSQAGGYLGALSLLSGMPGVDAYTAAVEHACEHSSSWPSIVSTSIRDAIQGHFGNHHSNPRTEGSRLFINPLMALLWFFDLPTLAQRVLFLDRLEGTETWSEVQGAIHRFRAGLSEIRDWEDIPL